MVWQLAPKKNELAGFTKKYLPWEQKMPYMSSVYSVEYK